MHPIVSRRTARRADGWIVGSPAPHAPAVRLFCLPYVGGAASVYEPWRGALGADVEVCPVELPGHQTRLREQALTRIDAIVEALASAITGELDVPYALFGHSLGSLVAFELARELRRRGAGEPRALFVSGGPAPRLPRVRPPVHDASESVVVDRLRSLGGLPDEVLAEPELLRRFLPTIRADFAVFETYEFTPERPLTCPVVAFTGSEDTDVPFARVRPWSAESTGRFEHHVLPGGHFFLHTARTALLNLVRGELISPVPHHEQDSHREQDSREAVDQ